MHICIRVDIFREKFCCVCRYEIASMQSLVNEFILFVTCENVCIIYCNYAWSEINDCL